MGNITQIRKNGTLITSYAYDTLGQLLSEYDYVNGLRYTNTYDKSGNITAKTTFDLSTLTTVGTINYTYGNSTWGDLLTSYNGTAITYDAIGNPTKWRNAAGLTWEARELQRTDLATGAYVDYTYNSDGIRTSRAYVNANTKYREDRTYILDGSKIIQENIKIATITSTTNATLYYLYDTSGEVQGFIYNNSYYYFQKNLQGDVVRILNSSGSVVVEYTYDAWGLLLTTTGSLASTVGKYNPFRYRSYYYDTETGFYYLQSRYYDPTVGRFLNADVYVATGQGIVGNNMFAYCGNNPVIRIDADGDIWGPLSRAFSEAFGWYKDNVILPTLDAAQTALSDTDFTYSNGLGGALSVGCFYFSGTAGIAIDSDGNACFTWAWGDGISTNGLSSTGTPYITGYSYDSITNAPSVDNIAGPQVSIGADVNVPIPNTPVSGYAGGEIDVLLDQDTNKAYYGYTDKTGISFPTSAGASVSVGGGKTYKTKSVNIFDWLREVLK